jgi:hypothetical protein
MASDTAYYLDDFGLCQCGSSRSGIEMMSIEMEVAPGRYRHKSVPACADCFGLL